MKFIFSAVVIYLLIFSIACHKDNKSACDASNYTIVEDDRSVSGNNLNGNQINIDIYQKASGEYASSFELVHQEEDDVEKFIFRVDTIFEEGGVYTLNEGNFIYFADDKFNDVTNLKYSVDYLDYRKNIGNDSTIYFVNNSRGKLTFDYLVDFNFYKSINIDYCFQLN